MLASVSPKVAECLEKAAKARRKASSASRSEDQEFWRDMELKWVRLAESYDQVDRVGDFLRPRKKPGSNAKI
jgi:hypothetical protein